MAAGFPLELHESSKSIPLRGGLGLGCVMAAFSGESILVYAKKDKKNHNE